MDFRLMLQKCHGVADIFNLPQRDNLTARLSSTFTKKAIIKSQRDIAKVGQPPCNLWEQHLLNRSKSMTQYDARPLFLGLEGIWQKQHSCHRHRFTIKPDRF